jgi:hypothetical protein
MDWERVIQRNRDALLNIVATVFALLGLEGGGSVARISRRLHRAALRLLVPAEAAARRLIVIAARDIVVEPRPLRPLPPGATIPKGEGARFAFRLCDPPRHGSGYRPSAAPRAIPRIHVFTPDPRVAALWPRPQPAAAPPPDPDIDAGRLCRRLAALKAALDDLPRQARRLARWRARREHARNWASASPLRAGPPPGHRRQPVYDVDDVLGECHGLALDVLHPDTS